MTGPIPIAVIGMGCRLPGGANSPEKLWDLLAEGRSGWSEVPSDRWNWKSFYHPNPEAKESVNSKSGYFLEQDIAAFDARFFGIPVWEAHAMDPQQRILLETTYEALENAGVPLQSLKGSDTAVYVGMYARDYDRMGYKDLPQITKIHITGTGEAVVANRISYLFDLKGPSLTIDTGCSGSMVALHQACQSLRTGETGMAIVGGTQLFLHPDQSIPMSSVGMVNPNGRCFVFDSRGSGYARGEGVGTVILKRLDDALKAGDPIHAVIRNSALNQDGKTAGISLPNSDAQAALMRLVYSSAGIDPRETFYVEAHGTGTQAGDDAEISSISSVFSGDDRDTDLYVGSVKSNIGHLEASSGVAGLIKGIMILKKGRIPPNIDFEKPKESLRLEERNIKIPLEVTPLPAGCRVSLNSFGYGGTNAHVILESAPDQYIPKNNGQAAPKPSQIGPDRFIPNKVLANGYQNGDLSESNGLDIVSKIGSQAKESSKKEIALGLLVLTAASEKSLRSNVKSLHHWIANCDEKNFSIEDLAYTFSFRRSLLPWRYSAVASTRDELASLLGEKGPRISRAATNVRVAFIFTGQGAQWYAMGRELIQGNSCFRGSILKSDIILEDLGCKWSLLDELLKDESTSKIGESQISQPATTAIQIALVDLLASFGIRPKSVCGHSSGEIAAAYAAGALSSQAAIHTAYHRGVWSSKAKEINANKGAMLAVGIGEKEVLPYVKQTKIGLATVACVNSPSSTTISGDDAAIDELRGVLDGLSIFNRKLKVDSAYHSHHMKKVAHDYCQSLEGIEAQAPQQDIIFYSSVSGDKKTSGFGPEYWTQNLVSKVRFSDALDLLTKNFQRSKQSSSVANFFVEIGPHNALAGPLRQTLTTSTTDNFKYSYLSALVRNQNAIQSVLHLAGTLFENGFPVDLKAVMSLTGSEGAGKTMSDLSPYSWDHSASFWHESRLSREHRFRDFPYHDLLGLLDVNSNIHEPRWRYHINVDTVPWLKDHVVDGLMIFPGSGYLCMVIEAMKQISQIRRASGKISKFVLRDITFSKSIIVPEPPLDGFTPEIEVQLTLSPSKNNNRWENFRIFSLSADGLWNEHCSGRISVEVTSKTDEVEGTREEDFENEAFLRQLDSIREACPDSIDAQKFYNDLRSSGNNFGSTFAALTEIHVGQCKGFTKLRIPDVAACMPHSYMQPHVIHPTTFDAINQLSAGLFKLHCSNSPLMPVYMGEVTVSADMTSRAGEELLIALEIKPEGPRYATGNCCAFQRNEDSSLSPVFTTTDLQLRGIGDAQTDDQDVPFQRNMSYRIEWQLDERTTPSTSISELPADGTNGNKNKSCPKIKILSELDTLPFCSLVDELSVALKEKGIQSSRVPWDATIDSNMTYLVLDDLEHPILRTPSQKRFEFLRTLFLETNSLMWVSAQTNTSPATTANAGLVTGVARVVRRENEGMRFITLEVQQDIKDTSSELVNAISNVFTTSFCSDFHEETPLEHEYAYIDGKLLVPRLQADTNFNNWINRIFKNSELETTLYQQTIRPLKLQVETPGLLSSLRFIDDLEAQSPLLPQELEIETRAYGVNFKDVFIALGQMLPGVNMVGEVAGLVSRVGSELQTRFQIGDRVTAVGARPFTSRARVNGFQACALPDTIPFAIGASIPTVFLTAYQCIFEVARLRRGQKILIHAASGGVGQAAIMFAQNVGAEIFATVGSIAKRQLIIDRYKIPESHIFSTRSRTFKQGILRLTKDKGVDVVLNSLSGEWLSDSWECVARLGTFVEIGKADIYHRNHISMVPFDRSVTFASVDLVVLFDAQPEEMSKRFSKVMSMFETGELSNLEPVTVMPMSDIEDAFRLISSRKHTGKVVLEVEETTMVKAVPAKPAPLLLDTKGSYLVAGGMGDLGKRICGLLANHGAKHIITLSRRTLNADALEALMSEFRDLGAEIHVLNCDIGDWSKMEEIASFCGRTLPPVKGVIHAGMVLRDHPLEQMTLEDYNLGLEPKVQGTVNLNRAYANPSLDFFVTLSSVSCILGKTGQMNYSAGNAFQDAFAHQYAKQFSTQYISLNLGAVDGSEAITSLPVRQRELMRQGAILMTFEELFKVLEYSMSEDARKDGCVQSILGFDRQSMEQAGDTFALNNPMFSQIPYLVKTDAGGIATGTVTVEDELRKVKSTDEAVDVICEAITEKFALFLNRPIEDLDPDQPPASFGLDSLVSIELKNWMVRTFKVALQTAEVGDATSLVALAKTIASRSKLISDELQAASEEEEAAEEAIPTSTTELMNGFQGPKCCRFAKTFPKYPLMDLDVAMNLLLDDVQPFASTEENAQLRDAIADFKKPGGLGLQTYQKLVDRANDPSIDNWLFDLHVEGVWLRRRAGLAPYSNFLATHHDGKVAHPQADRAALIATTAFEFKQAIESDTLEPHWYFGVPSCMDTWQWLFNATREPHVKEDKMRKFPGNNYCVVLRRGHVFKVILKDGEEDVSYAKLKATFEAIIDHVQDDGSWAGILTSDKRDSWAKIREQIQLESKANAEYLSVIDAAAFLICLDDGAPTNGPESVRQYYLGDGFNRWNDKCLQFVICTNGSSGYLVEHTMIDGLTVWELNDLIHKAIYAHQPDGMIANGTEKGSTDVVGESADHKVVLEEYALSTTPDIYSHMDTLRSRYITNTSLISYAYHILPTLGNNILATTNTPIKATFDLTIQLASLLYFGYNPASWEPVSLANFHKGRFAIIQVSTPSVLSFCSAAADDETYSLPERRKLLIQAANDYNARLRNAYNGNAYFRLMNALKVMWPENEPLAPLFGNEAWTKTHPRFIMSNMTDGGSLHSAYVMGDPQSVWISYTVLENEARFCVVGPAGGRLEKFLGCLDDAAITVRRIVEAN